MFNSHEIKARMKGIEDTKQITHAMQLISASKLKKAMKLYENNRIYFKELRFVIKDILTHSDKIVHPYFVRRDGKRIAFVIITSDKGLAGEYNKKVLEIADREINKAEEKYIFTIGNMANEHFKKQGREIDIEFLHIVQNPTLDDARQMTYDILELYDQNILDEVNIIYTSMQSASRNRPDIIKVLPLEVEDFKVVEDYDDDTIRDRFDFEPSPQEVVDILTPQYVLGLIYGALVQSVAAEHFERMVAMKTALDNADKMLKTLKLMSQRARQEKITTELQEITVASLGNA